MTDNNPGGPELDLLTEPETAQLLRCSPSKIKRLRLGGKLAYLPGRPVMIDRRAINDYLDRARVPAKSEAPDDKPRKSEAERQRDDARAWALNKVMTPPRARRAKAG